MKRDMDLVRNLLLAIERDPQLDGSVWKRPDGPEDWEITGCNEVEMAYHLRMLIEEGLVDGDETLSSPMPSVSRLTWNGHEFLDDIRDPSVWASVKQRAGILASVGLAIIGELAKAEIKKRLGLP